MSRIIEDMRRWGLTKIVPTQAAQDAWMEHHYALAEGALSNGPDSWYNGGNIPGKAKVPLLYRNTLPAYRAKLAELADNKYPGFILE